MDTILENRKSDRFYLVYSTIAGFMLIGFYYLLRFGFHLNTNVAFLITFLLFAVFFDIRHLFPTYSRTLLDKQFMKENKRWFNIAWMIIIVLPLLGFVLLSQGEYATYNSNIVFAFMLRTTYLLGFYHLVKQNWGFMAIYKKKFGEPEDGSDRWEKLMLLSGSFIPFVYLSKIAPVWFNRAGQIAFNPAPPQLEYVLAFWDKIASACIIAGIGFLIVGFVIKTIPQFKQVSRNLGFLFFTLFLLIKWILIEGKEKPLNIILILLISVFAVASFLVIKRTITKKLYNKEKFLVLISALVLYNGIVLIPLENVHLFAMAVTLPHNIQYLRFVNFFSKKYYANSKLDHGFAKVLASKALLFFVVSFFYALIFEVFRSGILMVPVKSSSFEYIQNMVSVFFLSMVMHHYFLDAVIWRVRKDKDLSATI